MQLGQNPVGDLMLKMVNEPEGPSNTAHNALQVDTLLDKLMFEHSVGLLFSPHHYNNPPPPHTHTQVPFLTCAITNV